MSALEEVIKWASEKIPAWQGDAVRRLLLEESLSKESISELYDMMKFHFNLLDNENIPKPKLPKIGEFSGTGNNEENITLKCIQCIENVNAIPDGNTLPVGHEGCTIIYGENATGKSGYARTLKRACNARDKKEKVIANIFNNGNRNPPTVGFKFDIGQKKDEIIKWKEGTPGPEEMSKITVFDSRCARIFLDEQNEFQYKPYGTHVFEELATLITSFKEKLDVEKPKPKKPEIENLRKDTEAWSFYENLSENTKDNEFLKYESWSEEDDKVLNGLITWGQEYQKQNLEVKISEANNYINKYLSLIREIRGFRAFFSKSLHDEVNEILTQLTATDKAHKIAEEAIKDDEFPLPGVRSKAWRQLFEAAEKFSQESAYPDHEYPNVNEGSKCVLCMQNLEQDAKERMRKFSEFVKDEIGNNLKKFGHQLKIKNNEISSFIIRNKEDVKNFISDIIETFPEIAKSITLEFDFYRNEVARYTDAIKTREILKVSTRNVYDSSHLFSLLKIKKSERLELEKLRNPEVVQKKTKLGKELLSQKAIHERISDIKAYIHAKKEVAKIQSCIDELDIRSISNKGRKIINDQSTPELQAALNRELEFLNVKSFNVNLKARGSRGITLHEIELLGSASKHTPSNILSEGEQRAVSIAGFFAELKLANHASPIVFDDPVTSLDHMFRDKIAERIAKESLLRQVIIFTHDISFLMEIEKHLSRLDGAKQSVVSLLQKNNLPGEVSSEKSWHIMSVAERIKFLDDYLISIAPLYNKDQYEYDKEAAYWYNLFREAWETIVEETVLNKVVKRFGGEILTQSVREIEVDDEDYKIIYMYMSKASGWMRGHDKSKPLSVHRPTPSEIRTDIDKTRIFIKKITDKKKKVGERRKALLKPQPSEMG